MAFVNTDGVVLDQSKIPFVKLNLSLKKGNIASTPPPGNGTGPVAAVSEIVKTTATFSWVKVSGASNYVVERDTKADFSTATQIYSGPLNIVEMTGLTQNTRYYIRVKATGTFGETGWTVKNFKTFWTPLASQLGGNRVATAADTSLDPFINVGDFLIVGSDSYPDGSRWGKDVWDGNIQYGGVGGNNGILIPQLGAGNKVCIMGGIGYDYIALDMSNNPGTATNKVIITNIGGQVRGKLYLNNFTHVKLTGKYDPVAKTGNAEFLGFDSTDWSNLNGSFGFYCQGEWYDLSKILSHVGGNTANSIIEYIESGEGGYSGMTVKNDNGTVPMTGMVMNNCYTHDTGSGEGYYIGSTQNPPQMPVIDFEMYDNVVVRAALNGIQIGNMKGANNLHNNTVVNSGYKYNNAFMKFQDQAIQFNARENGFSFTSNLVVGSAGNFWNWFMFPEDIDSPTTSQTSNVSNNLLQDARVYGAGYVSPRSSSGGVHFAGTVNHNLNYYCNLGNDTTPYNVIYTSNVKDNKVLTLADATGTLTFNATNNTYDLSINPGSFCSTNDTHFTVTQTGNIQANVVNRVKLNNYMDGLLDNNYAASEEWVDAQCPDWNKDNRYQTGFYDIQQANLSTSTTPITIPTVHPTVITATVGIGKRYPVGEKLDFTSGANTFKGTITAYNSSTGSVTLSSVSNSGTGSFSNWNVSLDVASIIIPRTYRLGEVVRYLGRFYKSLHDNNTSNKPSSSGDSHWELIIWSNGSTRPPDDVRIAADSFYGKLGMGLTKNAGTAANNGGGTPSAGGQTGGTFSNIIGRQGSDTIQLADQFSTAPALTWLPQSYNTDPSSTVYPLILNLHGMGEASSTPNLPLLLNTGIAQIIANGWNPEVINPVDSSLYKFIVCTPQHGYFSWGADGHWIDIQYILNSLKSKYRVDPTRIYITGYSAGAQGCVSAVTNNATLAQSIAAIMPISFTGWNTTIEHDNTPLIGGTYHVPMYSVVGTAETYYTRATELRDLYNSVTPSPLGILDEIPNATHGAGVWNTVYDLNNNWKTNQYNTIGDSPYEWLLRHTR